ncbi:hypothetical protein P344_01065 [Spiroplasma mirum ATCC 29335]|uniref:Uncharacterized protein n=1 Tax=Spiroplasma mirum ATCC 29335 TaxID=838561 RepID=W6ALK1_9MOLU|nr:hypothetical protein P344_01065 [Spiroplasma mirum ATCC 29335]
MAMSMKKRVKLMEAKKLEKANARKEAAKKNSQSQVSK